MKDYGGGKLSCKQCGYDIYEVLELDHLDNDGAKERKKIKSNVTFYQQIIKNNFPPKYQVLCKNCNWLKYRKIKKNPGP